MPSTVERMESRCGQLMGVTDVMEIRRRYQNVSVLWRKPTGQIPCDIGNSLRMVPPTAQRTQQVLGVILGPAAQLHAFTVRHLEPKRDPGCEDFLYRVKRPACGRPLGGVLGRMADHAIGGRHPAD